jgi:hypothetical protein
VGYIEDECDKKNTCSLAVPKGEAAHNQCVGISPLGDKRAVFFEVLNILFAPFSMVYESMEFMFLEKFSNSDTIFSATFGNFVSTIENFGAIDSILRKHIYSIQLQPTPQGVSVDKRTVF